MGGCTQYGQSTCQSSRCGRVHAVPAQDTRQSYQYENVAVHSRMLREMALDVAALDREQSALAQPKGAAMAGGKQANTFEHKQQTRLDQQIRRVHYLIN